MQDDDQISSLIRAQEERLARALEEARKASAELRALRGNHARKEPRASKYIWNIIREADAQKKRVTQAELEDLVMQRSLRNLHFYTMQRVRQSISHMLNSETIAEFEDKLIGPGPKFWDDAGL